MDKRYQIFISSTFADLQEERQEIMQALLELDCIPSGMELFPAANDDQWTLIQKVIDDSDYYIVVLGGRYGSIGPGGFSYTEMEYRYAVDTGKPVIAFLHRDPKKLSAERTESSEAGRVKLSEFRDLVQTKMCRFWDNPSDLGSQVSRSLVKLMKTNPAVGWVRADLVPNESAAKEILGLRKRVDELTSELAQSRVIAPAGAANLASGSELVSLSYTFSVSATESLWGATQRRFKSEFEWDELFDAISPLMMDEASDSDIQNRLSILIGDTEKKDLRKREEFKGKKLLDFNIHIDSYHTVIVQFRALGLIIRSMRSRSVKNTETYWTLTPYGDEYMTKLRAITKT